MDIEGRIVLFNKASQKLTGYKESEVINCYPWDLFILSDEAQRVKEVFNKLTLGNFPNQHINYWLTKAGEKRLISWSNTALGDENNRLAYIVATGIDITEQKLAEEKIAQNQKDLESLVAVRTAELQEANHKLELIAYKDVTTSLFNRRYFNKVLEREIRRARGNDEPLSLLIADVDYFKNYNDTYGHLVGDECLRIIADLFKQQFQRASDLVARYGGEEFCVILPNINNHLAENLAENFLDHVWNANIPHCTSSVADRVTLSIGVGTCLEHQICDIDSLIRVADNALYSAKNLGRNRVEKAHIEMLNEESLR